MTKRQIIEEMRYIPSSAEVFLKTGETETNRIKVTLRHNLIKDKIIIEALETQEEAQQ